MGAFTEALKETKTSLLKIMLFEEALNAILIFLAAYLISSLFRAGLWLPLILSGGYFAFATYKERRIRADKAVESKYRDLKEKLSTAAEYANVDNRVVNELKYDVLKNLRKVEESSFLSERRVYTKSIVAVALCFIILLLSPVSISFFKHTFPNIFPDLGGKDSTISGSNFRLLNENNRNDVPIGPVKSKEDIYGAPTFAKLGSEELKVILKPAGMELGTRNVKPPEELQFTEQYPEEVVSVAAESMEERIPKEQQELVRRYFRNVVEASR
ncbi:hypothetical protein HYU40_00500 [Candidatus Woesearchaeota archaeon]|nr:hypothetical protein [Candidatus Woesearchaeota archaeon]